MAVVFEKPKALADLLQDLQLSGYDVGATGFDAAEVDDLFSKVHDKNVKDDDCDIDPEAMQPFVQPGDVWTLGRHRMVCGDSTNPDHVELLMDGLKANLVVTDPPYNVAYESADGKSIQNDSMADEKFYEFPAGRISQYGCSYGGRRLCLYLPCRYGRAQLPQSFQGSRLSHQRRLHLGQELSCPGQKPLSVAA